ncbi:MAG: hypothetical protein LC799_15680 [Actinobacteria bacterium]|nr:hypothetical protein [Actinomycetota bacterium]
MANAGKLIFKFRNDSSSGLRAGVVARLQQAGAAAVRPLFPDDTDDELSSMYVLESGARSGGGFLELLQDCDEVEYAEPEPKRRLAR